MTRKAGAFKPAAGATAPTALPAIDARPQYVPVQLGRDQARRFLVGRHLLAPPRALPARPSSVMTVVDRLGSLQFDPLEAPGARNHELVLHARIAGFRREWCEAWLYGRSRRLFEAWNKGLSLLPVAELAAHRLVWDHAAERYDGFLARHAGVVERIVETITARGPLAVGAFGKSEIIDWWWGGTPVHRAVIDVLFLCGRLGIARRERNARHYDLLERLFPRNVLSERMDAEEAHRRRLLSRARGIGLLRENAAAELVQGTGTAGERRRRLAALVDEGSLAPVTVEGARGTFYGLPGELGGRKRSERSLSFDRAAFLAPLDPLLWDRRLLRELWSFDYIWEVYTPLARRRWGYYVLPILHGDRLVGRIEPRFTRADGILEIAGLWLEEDVDPDRPGLEAAFAAALADYAAFVGATRVTWRSGLRGRERELARRTRARPSPPAPARTRARRA